MNARCLALYFLALTLTAADSFGGEPIVIYVSADAQADGTGTTEQPFDSLEKARDALRAMPRRGQAEVILKGSRYFREHSFELTNEDGNVVYRAAEGEQVFFDGGRVISKSSCLPVTDEAVTSRLVDSAAAKRLLFIDLKAMGIDEFGEFGPRGFRRRQILAPVELFVDSAPLTIARWPNVGEPDIPLGEVIDSGSALRYNKEEPLRPGAFKYETQRAEKWTQANDIFLQGFFSNGFADDSIPVDNIDTTTGVVHLGLPHFYGVGTGKPPSVWGWHAENLLEEIDQPSEYYLDRENGLLYFLPPEGFDRAEDTMLQVSQLSEPFVAAEDIESLTFQSITFENSRGDGAEFQGGKIKLIDCTFRNIGGRGLTLAGKNNMLEGCELIDLGAGGVHLSGGNRRTLEPGGNIIRHCDISRVNRWYRTYRPAIHLSGVGNQVQHNHLHNCPGQGITMSGNDHLIEYNEFGHLIGTMSDQGAIYLSRNPSYAGNVFRYNFFHDTVSHHAGFGNSGIFFDDGVSNQFVHSNVFYNTGKNGAIKYHGGQYNSFINNVVIDCRMPIKYLLWDQQRWEIFLAMDQQINNLLKQVNVLAPPYSIRYPHLAAIFETPYSREPFGETRNWITTAEDPLFENGKEQNFQILDYDSLRKQVPGFAEIPWDKIGPQPRENRTDDDPVQVAKDLVKQQKERRGILNKQYDDAQKKRPLWMRR